jgi:hypothetical protein
VKLPSSNLSLTINSKEQIHYAAWDYAYTSTGYNAQGTSQQYVIDYEMSYRKNLTHQRSFYIAVSRAKKHVMIYTDNKEALLQKLMTNEKNKYSALKVIGELPKKSSLLFLAKKAFDTVEKTYPSSSLPWDVKDITAQLERRTSEIVERLFGQPKSRTATHYQYSYSEHFGGESQKKEGSLYVASR